MNIFIHRDGQQFGPFGEAEVKSQLAAGTISRQDLAWWEGQAGWVPLDQTFLTATATPPAPAPVDSPAVMPATRVAPVAQTEKTSGMAIGSLVCGVSSYVVAITFIVAIILGHLSLSEIKRNPGMKGRGMAIAGLILGYVWPVFAIAIIWILLALGQEVRGTLQSINAQTSTETTNASSDSDSEAPGLAALHAQIRRTFQQINEQLAAAQAQTNSSPATNSVPATSTNVVPATNTAPANGR